VHSDSNACLSPEYIFQHIHYYDAPFICSQSMVMGSNIDFMTAKQKSHNVEYLLPEVVAPSDPFISVNDFHRNEMMANQCIPSSSNAQELVPQPTIQEKSPGIIMIIEAEELAGNIQSFKQVSKRLEEALQEKGFNVVSSWSLQDGMMGVILTNEGYVAVRLWPQYNYCALDVHLWSSFEKHRAIQKALVTVLGGNNKGRKTSSYRIVAGGMFGVSTWQVDEMNRGPVYLQSQPDQACDGTEDKSPLETDKPVMSSDSAVNSFLEESASLIGTFQSRVVVLCGPEGGKCSGTEILKKVGIISSVLNIHACPGLPETIEDDDHGTNSTFACEKQIHLIFNNASTEGHIDAIVIDPSAPLSMAQIMLRLLNSAKIVNKWLKKDFLILAPLQDQEVSSKLPSARMNFIDIVKKNIFHEDSKDSRVFVAGVLLTDSPLDNVKTSSNTHSLGGMAVFSKGRLDFVSSLMKVAESWQKKTGLAATVHKIRGGYPWFQDDWYPSLVTTPKFKHYDMSDAQEQWKSQRSLGLQTILQFETSKPVKPEAAELETVAALNKEELAEVLGMDPAELNMEALSSDDGIFEIGTEEDPLADDAVVELSAEKIKSALAQTVTSLLELAQDETMMCLNDDQRLVQLHGSSGLGEGYVSAAFWATGIAVALWDGRSHVDVNLFTMEESIEHADFFEEAFGAATGLHRTLRDQQPRGTGRVVNLSQDASGYAPHWL